MMRCKLCGSNQTKIQYRGKIRSGGVGVFTEDEAEMYNCMDCGVIWHESLISERYYESEEYRKGVDGSSLAEDFYKLHDKNILDKFQYTGTEIFRNKIVADIGCACGAFLDFIRGVANNTIAVEPSEVFRKVMQAKGYKTYAYTEDAKEEYRNKIDIITSFDVIEHVENPEDFLRDIFDLLVDGGKIVIGTPTDSPIMRELLGEIYEKQVLYSVQHMYILSEKNLRLLAERIGYKNIHVKYFQRYGMENLVGWLREKRPCADINATFISNTLNETWKRECENARLADYIVLYATK